MWSVPNVIDCSVSTDNPAGDRSIEEEESDKEDRLRRSSGDEADYQQPLGDQDESIFFR